MGGKARPYSYMSGVDSGLFPYGRILGERGIRYRDFSTLRHKKGGKEPRPDVRHDGGPK